MDGWLDGHIASRLDNEQLDMDGWMDNGWTKLDKSTNLDEVADAVIQLRMNCQKGSCSKLRGVSVC